MIDCGVSRGMATNTGSPARAPYAESAAPALPAVGAARLRAPSFFAIVTAAAIPRDLNDRVGFFDSSLMKTFARARDGSSGVIPSPSVTISLSSSTGSTSMYRHISLRAHETRGDAESSYCTRIGALHRGQRL